MLTAISLRTEHYAVQKNIKPNRETVAILKHGTAVGPGREAAAAESLLRAVVVVACCALAVAGAPNPLIRSKNGVVVNFGKHYVELAVASSTGFRVSIATDQPDGPVSSPIVVHQPNLPSFTPISNGLSVRVCVCVCLCLCDD